MVSLGSEVLHVGDELVLAGKEVTADPSPLKLNLRSGACQPECIVLEVMVTEGQGTTIIVSVGSEVLHEGDKLIFAGKEGLILAKIQALIAPHPREFEEPPFKGNSDVSEKLKPGEEGSIRFSISGEGLQNAISGKKFYVVRDNDNEDLKRSVMKQDI